MSEHDEHDDEPQFVAVNVGDWMREQQNAQRRQHQRQEMMLTDFVMMMETFIQELSPEHRGVFLRIITNLQRVALEPNEGHMNVIAGLSTLAGMTGMTITIKDSDPVDEVMRIETMGNGTGHVED